MTEYDKEFDKKFPGVKEFLKTTKPSWEKDFYDLLLKNLTPVKLKDLLNFIRQTIKDEREKAIKNYVVITGEPYDKIKEKEKIKQQAVREVEFWIKDWWAEDCPFGINGLIKKIKKLK